MQGPLAVMSRERTVVEGLDYVTTVFYAAIIHTCDAGVFSNWHA